MRVFGRHYGHILRRLSYGIVGIMAWMACELVCAEDLPDHKASTPLGDIYANWVFSGSVANETGDAYEFFFQVKRNEQKVHAIVSLIDVQSKAVIFMEDADTLLTAEDVDNWTMGNIFLRYNAINSSWVLGLNKGNQVGFNFKVDMLNQPDHDPVLQNLRQGVKMVVVQTGQVNGHVQLKEGEVSQFVTGKNAWFRQIVFAKAQTQPSELQGLLCRFDDGSGLYSMKMLESDAIRGTLSGLLNADGTSLAISQFIHVEHLNDGPWHVRVPYPKLQFDLSNVLQHQSLVLGFMSQKDKQGFCVISQEG